MKKYNVKNYVRYKEDIKESMPDEEFDYIELTRDQLIVKFLPLVENVARKFSTTQQASGVLDITDLLQIGSIGLIKAVDRLDWNVLNESEDIEKTLKSFFSKRIRGAIRRRIDALRGDMRIPEHKITEIRKNNGKDHKMVAMFFNSIFSSIDEAPRDEENPVYNIEDKSPTYNIGLMNAYLIGLMKEFLTHEQYEVIRLSYGLDCDKHSAIQIAKELNMKVNTAIVRVSQIKRDGIKALIQNTDRSQVIDYL